MPRLSKNQHALLTATVDRWLKKNYREPIDLPALAEKIGITRFLLCRLYHERSGKSIRLKQREIRIQHAAELLSCGNSKVSDVAREVGYGSMSHFTKAFLEETGELPSNWKSRPRTVAFPETSGNLPAPGLLSVRAIGASPGLSYSSGHWRPGWTHDERPRRGTRVAKSGGERLTQANGFLD